MTITSRIMLTLALATTLGWAQDAKKDAKKQPAKRESNPILAQIDDKPGLPRVLLLGDSISMGYTLPVRKLMEGKANVHRPATNCGPTTNGVKNIDSWLGTGKWDVIHFNFGLHDLKYVDEKLNLVEPSKGKQQVTPEDYEKNLETLVSRMKQTGAKLIFATTTPVPEGSSGRVKGEELRYNEIALKVMKKQGVVIDDLHAQVLPELSKHQRPANVHFTDPGSEFLATKVVASINQALAK